MRTIIGLGALLTTSLLFASDARADWFGRSRCSRPCQPAPSCAQATTASVQGTTIYSASYHPAGASERASSFRSRADEIIDMQRRIKGYGR